MIVVKGLFQLTEKSISYRSDSDCLEIIPFTVNSGYTSKHYGNSIDPICPDTTASLFVKRCRKITNEIRGKIVPTKQRCK